MHGRLGPAMEAYYAALGRRRPGTVHRLDAEGDARPAATALLGGLAPHGYARCAVAVLDRWKEDLDRALADVAEQGPVGGGGGAIRA